MHQNDTSDSLKQAQKNQQLVNNAMTMQKALETAYNDWNKDKNVPNETNDSSNNLKKDLEPEKNLKSQNEESKTPKELVQNEIKSDENQPQKKG